MKLYDYGPAPNPRRVRIFAAEKGITLPLISIDLKKREQLGEAFRRINPRCTIPVLETDDGHFICETNAICHYLDAIEPKPALLGDSPLESAMVRMWVAICDADGFDAIAEAYRNHSHFFKNRSLTGTNDKPQIPALAERGRDRAFDFLEQLESRLSESPYLAGEHYSFADITAFAYVDFARWIKVHISEPQRNLRTWYDRISERPSTVIAGI